MGNTQGYNCFGCYSNCYSRCLERSQPSIEVRH